MKGLARWPHLALLAIPSLLIADEPRDRAVEIEADAQGKWPVITLRWRASELPIIKQEIFRRLKDGQIWGEPIASPAPNVTNWIDGSALPNVAYEYAITREYGEAPGRAVGYVHAGYEVDSAEKGKVILIIEASVADALKSELDRWREDLNGDGWIISSRTVGRDRSHP